MECLLLLHPGMVKPTRAGETAHRSHTVTGGKKVLVRLQPGRGKVKPCLARLNYRGPSLPVGRAHLRLGRERVPRGRRLFYPSRSAPAAAAPHLVALCAFRLSLSRLAIAIAPTPSSGHRPQLPTSFPPRPGATPPLPLARLSSRSRLCRKKGTRNPTTAAAVESRAGAVGQSGDEDGKGGGIKRRGAERPALPAGERRRRRLQRRQGGGGQQRGAAGQGQGRRTARSESAEPFPL
jgi:hypothetical protein